MAVLTLIEGVIGNSGIVFLEVWSNIWWVVTPFFLGFIFIQAWLFYIRFLYVEDMNWVTLRIKTPRESQKTPKAMEQVFSAAYSTYSHGLRLSEIYWDGKVEEWTSFELSGYSGGVAYYIRTLEKFRPMYESAIYAQYPEAEIDVVDDYTSLLPQTLPNKSYDLWGSDMLLARDSGYPIRTWSYWETLTFEEKVDTMAAILEVMSKLKDGEMIWMQFLIKPTGPDDSWIKEGEELRDKLIGKKASTHKRSLGVKAAEFINNFLLAPFRDPKWAEEKKEEKSTLARLTPGEKNIVEGVENKISKLGFESVVRWMYIGRRDVFTMSTASGVLAAFRQFNTLNMNSLRPNKPTLTIGRQPFKRRRVWLKKRRLYDYYGWRKIPSKVCIFNIEELATMYHFPTTLVMAPMLRRVEAKKGSPPPVLPTE